MDQIQLEKMDPRVRFYGKFCLTEDALEETTDVGPDSSDNESDGSWKQMFQFRSSQPVRVRSKQGSNSTDASAKQKNIKKLKNAMVLSYHHNEGC